MEVLVSREDRDVRSDRTRGVSAFCSCKCEISMVIRLDTELARSLIKALACKLDELVDF